MSDYEPKDNTASLFQNTYKEDGDKKPNMTGTGMIDGKKIKVSAWWNESKSGKKYLGLTFSPFTDDGQPFSHKKQYSSYEDMDDPIPFN